MKMAALVQIGSILRCMKHSEDVDSFGFDGVDHNQWQRYAG